MTAGAVIAATFGGFAILVAILLPAASLSRAALALVAVVIPIGLAVYGLGAWLFSASYERAKALHYVPPVLEKVDPDAPEQLLVRGSDEPDTSPDEMLRTAAALSDEPALLLRVGSGASGGSLDQTANSE
jgi:hypothetical protein